MLSIIYRKIIKLQNLLAFKVLTFVFNINNCFPECEGYDACHPQGFQYELKVQKGYSSDVIFLFQALFFNFHYINYRNTNELTLYVYGILLACAHVKGFLPPLFDSYTAVCSACSSKNPRLNYHDFSHLTELFEQLNGIIISYLLPLQLLEVLGCLGGI